MVLSFCASVSQILLASQYVNSDYAWYFGSHNNTIVYSYDGNHRLIKTQSPSTIEEYGYDNEGRELTLSKTQTYFTIEKNLTTCEEWNSHGECTRAIMDITITPTYRTGKQYVDKHNAVMTAKYEYWN